MASPTHPPPFSDKELEQGLKDAGATLQTPPSSTDELLNLLDKVECLLSKIDQVPSRSVLDALQPCMKALTGTELLRHANTDVKVSIASCISEITRIMAPDSPFSDEEMKEYFQLSVMAVEKISYTSGSCYLKAVSVLKTLANIRVCVLMLDLELDELIIQMFQQFLDTNSQPDVVLSYMEKIMTLVIEESEEPSLELLSLLLTSVKRENQNVSRLAWELGQKVLKNCADKLKPDLPKAVRSMGIAYHDYAEVVASICQDTPGRDFVEINELVPDAICLVELTPAVDDLPKSVMNNDTALTNKYDTQGNEKSLKVLHHCQQRGTDSRSNSQLENIDAREEMTQELHPEAIQKKRGRRPNSLRKEEEGYDHSWIIGVSSSLKIPCRTKNPKKKNRNPSKSSAFESASPSEPGKETQPHVLSVRNVHRKSMTSSPSQNHSHPDGIHPKLHQKKKIDSLMNQDSGLDLLSVSVGDLLRAQDEEKASQRAAATLRKESESTVGAKAKRRRGLGNNASESTGDAKAKHRQALGKNVSESTGDSKVKVRRGLLKNIPPSKTVGICSDLERKQELSVWQIDAMEQKIGINTPDRHATENPADEIGYIEASKVKHKRKCALPKEEVHDEELVGCKIKVWWPMDKMFYAGVITAFDPERKKHKVKYMDGDEEILYLREERWELVEDGEDSEATEDNKSGVNASTNWFCNAKTGSSGLAKTNYNYKARSCKRTKCRILQAEKGEKSLAEILSVSAEPQCPSQVANACSGTIDVHGYKVKASTAPLLGAIFAKHGDIAAHCLYKSAAVRASLLEVVCDIVKRLQSNPIESIISELQAIENEVSDAEAAKLQVSWLEQYLKKIREVEEVGQRSLLLKDMKANTILVTKAAKRDLEQKQLELVAAQERLREAERCVKALACVGEKISNDILDSEAKESSWRKLVDELRYSLARPLP